MSYGNKRRKSNTAHWSSERNNGKEAIFEETNVVIFEN